MCLKVLTLLLVVAVATAKPSSSEDNDQMDHEYHVFVHQPKHDSAVYREKEDQIDVHIHNPHAAQYHANKQQNYIIHIHEETAGESHAPKESGKKSEKKKVHPLTTEEKKAVHEYWDNVYHFFVEDHEERYDYAECDIVPDAVHSQGVNLTGRVVFKQNVHGGPLHYQVELHGFKSDQPDHGMHVHEYGDIINDCTKVGGHYNPTNKKHGLNDDKERHVGDFGELHADEHGNIRKEYHDKVATLHGVHSILGRALVIDNHKDKAGDDELNHMGCCVIARSPGENWHDDWPHN